jgi:hypothetical protein
MRQLIRICRHIQKYPADLHSGAHGEHVDPNVSIANTKGWWR